MPNSETMIWNLDASRWEELSNTNSDSESKLSSLEYQDFEAQDAIFQSLRSYQDAQMDAGSNNAEQTNDEISNDETEEKSRDGPPDKTHESTNFPESPIIIKPNDIGTITTRNLILNAHNLCPCGRYQYYGRCGHLYEDYKYHCGKTRSRTQRDVFCTKDAQINVMEGFVVDANCGHVGCRKSRLVSKEYPDAFSFDVILPSLPIS